MINLNQLRFFCELARQNSFSKAADICCVTQPTLSNAIAQLETLLDGKLFNRSTRQVKLTSLGKHMLPLAEAVLVAQEEFTQGANAFSNPQTKLLRIGISPLVNMQLLTDVIAPFQNQYPDLEVFFKECFLDDLGSRMEDETIDLAVMPKREMPIHFDKLKLYSEPLYYLPKIAFGAGQQQTQSEVLLSDVSNETIIVTMGGCGLKDRVEELFSDHDLKIKKYQGQAISYKVVEDWSAVGIGASILPQSKLSEGNTQVSRLLCDTDTPAVIDYEVSYPRHIERAQHIDAFLTYLNDVAPQIIAGRAA